MYCEREPNVGSSIALVQESNEQQQLLLARGRHRIRKLIDGRKLCSETKAAQKIEKERRERLRKEHENVRTR